MTTQEIVNFMTGWAACLLCWLTGAYFERKFWRAQIHEICRSVINELIATERLKVNR